MRATLFHNPSAGGKAAKDEILAAMKLVDFDAHYVSVKDHDLKEAFKKKADLIVVAGGDGTIAEVLIRLPDRSLPVALLPLGTANNIVAFARHSRCLPPLWCVSAFTDLSYRQHKSNADELRGVT